MEDRRRGRVRTFFSSLRNLFRRRPQVAAGDDLDGDQQQQQQQQQHHHHHDHHHHDHDHDDGANLDTMPFDATPPRQRRHSFLRRGHSVHDPPIQPTASDNHPWGRLVIDNTLTGETLLVTMSGPMPPGFEQNHDEPPQRRRSGSFFSRRREVPAAAVQRASYRASMAQAFNAMREEILDAITLVLIDRHELDIAEMEMDRLERLLEVEMLEAKLEDIQKEHIALQEKINAATDSETIEKHQNELHEVEKRLVINRLLVSVASIGSKLLRIRQQSQPGLPSFQSNTEALERDLRQNLSLLEGVGGTSATQANLLQIERERVEAKRLEPERSVRPDKPLQDQLSYIIKCHRLRVVFLKKRTPGKFEIALRRDQLLEDSLAKMRSVPALSFRKRIVIQYDGEQGKDFGGLSRDWISKFSSSLVERMLGLNQLEFVSSENYALQIVSDFAPTAECLDNMVHLGRVLALALFHGKVVDFKVSRLLLKVLLGHEVQLSDVADVDPVFYDSMCYIQNCDDVESLDLTFSVDKNSNGKLSSHDLISNGGRTVVTKSNVEIYVASMLKWRYSQSIARQLECINLGFYSIIDKPDLSHVTATELELLVCGLLDISVNDWLAHTVYDNGYTAESQVVVWFWEAVRAFTPEMRKKLLQFVTGCSQLPVQGFSGLQGTYGPCPFSIYRNEAPESLPVGHTCINRLDLPPYPSYEELVKKLTLAIDETDGFHIV